MQSTGPLARAGSRAVVPRDDQPAAAERPAAQGRGRRSPAAVSGGRRTSRAHFAVDGAGCLERGTPGPSATAEGQ
eukprot:4081018-Alexandrium_andersonii.AAC.1